jgi:hypothetical protein
MNLNDLMEEGHDYDEQYPDPILPPEAPCGPALEQWLGVQSIRQQECARDIARLLRAFGWRMVQAGLSDALRGLDKPDPDAADLARWQTEDAQRRHDEAYNLGFQDGSNGR